MAVRTAYDAVAGTTLTAANLDKYPGGWIGYVGVTSTQSPITSVTDLTSLTLTVTVGTSRRILVTGKAAFSSTVTTDIVALYLTDGANGVLDTHNILMSMGTGAPTQAEVSVILTPSSGSNTWKLRAQRISGSGTITMEASASPAAYIMVEDLGPAS